MNDDQDYGGYRPTDYFTSREAAESISTAKLETEVFLAIASKK
jgi:hypothetical protein